MRATPLRNTDERWSRIIALLLAAADDEDTTSREQQSGRARLPAPRPGSPQGENDDRERE
jgi:hypothetical protein